MSNSKVYILDDDPSICDAFTWLLKSIGINPSIFQSPKKFLEFYTPSLTGCLVLDVRMPEMSGMALLARLMKEKTKLAVIMLTGHGDIPMAVLAIKMGAHDFITKPFDHQMLIEKIQNVLNTENTNQQSSVKDEISECYNSLNEREQKILTFVTAGNMNKQIAVLMGISIS